MPRLPVPTRAQVLLMVMVALAVGAIGQSVWAAGMPHPHKAAKQQIEELEEQWRQAALTNDVATMDHMLSDDYVGISWNGQVNTKAMQLDRVRNRVLMISKLDLSDEKVKLVGDVAIVTARADVQAISEGNDMGGTFRYTRVYQRLPPGIWKITNFELTRVPQPGDRQRRAHGPATE